MGSLILYNNGPSSAAIKVALTIKLLFVDLEGDIDVIVDSEPGILCDVLVQGFACSIGKSLHSNVRPLLAHDNAEHVECVESLCCQSTTLEIYCHEFLKLAEVMRA